MNWRWPETEVNGYFPWYMIAWHAIWIGPYYLARLVFVTIVGIHTLNVQQLHRAWDDTE